MKEEVLLLHESSLEIELFPLCCIPLATKWLICTPYCTSVVSPGQFSAEAAEIKGLHGHHKGRENIWTSAHGGLCGSAKGFR